jgi:putative transcriptional regulator
LSTSPGTRRGRRWSSNKIERNRSKSNIVERDRTSPGVQTEAVEFPACTTAADCFNEAILTSLRGQFLVANPELGDDNFAQTVVLIMSHGADGATGLVLNRPMEVTVAQAMGDIVEEANQVDSPLFEGGPCEGPIFGLHDNGQVDGEIIVETIRVTVERKSLQRLLKKPRGQMRLFTGYAGWAPMQLEGELGRDDGWLIVPATANDVFAPVEGLWEKLVARWNLLKFVRPDQIPPDANLN